MNSSAGIVIFRECCYPFSETFIREQAARLRDSRVVGYNRVHDLPRLPNDVILGDLRPRRAVLEARLLKLARRSLWLDSILLKDSPNTILAHSTYEAWSLLPTVRRLNIPMVVAVHGSDVTRTPAAVPRSHHSLRSVNAHFAELAAHVRFFLPASQFLATLLRHRGVPGDKIRPHYVGIPIPASAAPEERPPRISFVGRLAPGKGVGLLIEAFSLLPSEHNAMTLTIVGTGPLAASLRAQAGRSTARNRIEFAGQQPPERVREIMRTSSLIVVPSEVGSDGVREGLGQVSLEAQSHGTPVLVTDVGGLPETLPPGQNHAVPAGNMEALATALDELLAQPSRLQSSGSAGRAWVRNQFDIDRQTLALQEVLESGT